MQIGIITVNGRHIGVVSLTEGIRSDTSQPMGYSPEAPIGDVQSAHTGGRSGSGGHHQIGHARTGETQSHPGGRATTGPTSVGAGEDPRGMESHIRSEATRLGRDPDTAVAVAKSEGLRDRVGDHGTSFGAFQLHTPGGLGDEFRKETGLDPSDLANEKATITWALQNLDKTGWSPYHGAARVGISKWDGIKGNQPSTSDQTSGPVKDQTAPSSLKGDDVSAFIVHHTGGRGTPEGVQNTLRDRGLGVEYIMDREGNITHAGDRGSAHMLKGWGAGEGLSNRNTVGMEVIAKDNNDVTPAQIASGKAFIDKNYSGIPVYGHGEVNPGHKEADEGMGIVNAVRGGRQRAATDKKIFDPETMVP